MLHFFHVPLSLRVKVTNAMAWTLEEWHTNINKLNESTDQCNFNFAVCFKAREISGDNWQRQRHISPAGWRRIWSGSHRCAQSSGSPRQWLHGFHGVFFQPGPCMDAVIWMGTIGGVTLQAAQSLVAEPVTTSRSDGDIMAMWLPGNRPCTT